VLGGVAARDRARQRQESSRFKPECGSKLLYSKGRVGSKS